jgi:seryl-tRNA synthetase
MLDIRLIREKPDFVRERLATRGGSDEARIDEVLRVDAERRKVETALQQLNADRKRLSKEIGGKKARGEATDEIEEGGRQISAQIADLNASANLLEEQQGSGARNSNLPHKTVPIGKDPSANRVVRSWGGSRS